jgi:hypothetical protein
VSMFGRFRCSTITLDILLRTFGCEGVSAEEVDAPF